MAEIDFAAHNAEVAEMWAAYHQGEPYRVPIIVGHNVRYTMWRPEANPNGIDFVTYCSMPSIMLRRQLEHQHWVLHHLVQDQAMGLPEQGWSVHTDFQNTYEAAWFGCPLRFHERQVPDTAPLLTDDHKRLLFDRGLPDPFTAGVMAKVWDFYGYFKTQIDMGYEFAGKPLIGAGVCGLGTDGPVTVACNLRGATEFLTDLLIDPDYADELLTYITEATIARIKAFRRKFDQPMKTQGWGFADDSIALLSVEAYQERVLPHHRRLVDEFSEGGPNSVHLCGDATHLFATLQEELNIQHFDTGYPIDHGKMRQVLGEGATIQGGPSMPLLCSRSTEAVRHEVRRICESGVMQGGKFILREGNNLAPEVPLENVLAMYEAGREFGVYREPVPA